MTATPETFKAAWIANLKSKPTLVALVGEEIRETEYQSTDWTYPCIRVAVGFRPASIYCGPNDGEIDLEVYTDEKSSKEATHIASEIYLLYHGHPFEQNGIKFSTVVVREVTKPERSIFAWLTTVKIFAQGV